MNVWVLQLGESLPLTSDVRRMRTAFLCQELAERGHSITWWAGAFDHLKKRMVFDADTTVQLQKNIRIFALKGIGYTRNVSLRRYIDYQMVAWKFRDRIQTESSPDAIVASIPSHLMAYEAASYAKERGIPFLLDIRDQWPDIFVERVPKCLRGAARGFLMRDFRVSRIAIRQADALVSMMDVLLEWGLRCAGRTRTDRDKVFYLGYEKTGKTREASPGMKEIIEKIRGKFVVSFVGSMGHYNNPSAIVEGARLVNGNDEIVFVIGGDGIFFEAVRKKAAGLGNVLFPGWLNNDDINALLSNSHIGVCPTPFVANFFPNKAFMYLSMGLPVLSAFEGDLKEILENDRIGFHFPPNDAKEFIDKVHRLSRDRMLYEEMVDNVKRTFMRKFDSEMIYKRYADHIESVCRDFSGKNGVH